ncbi:bacteriocin [Lactococcus lactis]|uniref:bacteriocin n=1 Tax=Lactococcus lactis TaxID=1358 RepID=UPI003F298378
MKNNSDFEQLFLDNFKELTEEELMETNGGGLIDWVMKHQGAMHAIGDISTQLEALGGH